MSKEELIRELRHVAFEDGQSIERRQAELISNWIIARETAMLEEIGDVLRKAMNYYSTVPDSEDRWKVSSVLSDSIDEALSIIQRRKGGE